MVNTYRVSHVSETMPGVLIRDICVAGHESSWFQCRIDWTFQRCFDWNIIEHIDCIILYILITIHSHPLVLQLSRELARQDEFSPAFRSRTDAWPAKSDRGG